MLYAGDSKLGAGDLVDLLAEQAVHLAGDGAQMVNGVDEGLHGVVLESVDHPEAGNHERRGMSTGCR